MTESAVSNETTLSEENYYTMSSEQFSTLSITTLEKYQKELEETIEYLEYLYSIVPDESYQESKKSSEEVLEEILKIIEEKYDNNDYSGCECPPLE
jgi:hypothetical protein